MSRIQGKDSTDNTTAYAGIDVCKAWLDIHLLAGEREEARGLLEALIERSRQGYVDPIHMTRIHAGLRSGDEFFEWLERAYQTGSLWLSWLNISPVFDEVREDPRFREIVGRVGLPQG